LYRYSPVTGIRSVFFSATVQYFVSVEKACPPNGSTRLATNSFSISATSCPEIRYPISSTAPPT